MRESWDLRMFDISHHRWTHQKTKTFSILTQDAPLRTPFPSPLPQRGEQARRPVRPFILNLAQFYCNVFSSCSNNPNDDGFKHFFWAVVVAGSVETRSGGCWVSLSIVYPQSAPAPIFVNFPPIDLPNEKFCFRHRGYIFIEMTMT